MYSWVAQFCTRYICTFALLFTIHSSEILLSVQRLLEYVQHHSSNKYFAENATGYSFFILSKVISISVRLQSEAVKKPFKMLFSTEKQH